MLRGRYCVSCALKVPQIPELEQRLSELQAQIDRLTLSLHLWRQTQERLQPMENRLSQLTDHCAEILNQWTATGERHAHAVGELEARLNRLSTAEARLQEEASYRFRDLERTIEQEWSTIRQVHEEPVKQLREQAATLTEVCIAAAGTAQRSFDRAESRLTALETDLQSRMTELTREMRTVVAELRARPDQRWALSGAAPAWPLDDVMRLHDQLRKQGEELGGRLVPLLPQPPAALVGGAPDGAREPPPPARPPDEALRLTERLESLERALSDGQAELREATVRGERAGRMWRRAAVVGAIAIVGLGASAWWLQRGADATAARAVEAQRQAQLAAEAANERAAATRDAAARQIAEAREAARRAQIVGDVLAAPDLVRYNLVGGTAVARSSAQVLWSRSRGLVFSGSRLPAAPSDAAFQVWLLTAAGPISAGLVVPDASGRAMLATDTPPKVPGPVVGVSVTIEQSGGRESPSGEPILARAPAP